MKDRIRQLMEALNMTQQTFAKFIGMSTATLSNIYNGKTKPTLNTVEAIRSKFPNINIDWLMFGNGTMFVDDQQGAVPSSTPQERSNAEQTLDFGDYDSVDDMSSDGKSSPVDGSNVLQGKNRAASQPVHTDIVCNESGGHRKITEIRVFFDDQTWESFVPKK